MKYVKKALGIILWLSGIFIGMTSLINGPSDVYLGITTTLNDYRTGELFSFVVGYSVSLYLVIFGFYHLGQDLNLIDSE